MTKRVLIFFAALCCGALFAAEADVRQLRAYLDKELFEAAEIFCNDKFQQTDFPEADKILLATELVRSYSQQLPLLEPARQAGMNRRLESFETTWLTTPNTTAPPELALAKITLRLQLAMAYQSLGDYQRCEADIASETNRRVAYQQARITLQDALKRLKVCRDELQMLRQRVEYQELLALEYTITMQQGIAQKSSALTLQKEEERNFELRQAAEMLSELAAKNSAEPIIVQCKVEKAACHRLCGELDRCAEILEQLRTATLTPECRLRTEAEWIRYNIAIGNVAEMRRLYSADRADSKIHPDFDLARLELFLVNDPARNIYPEPSKVMTLEQSINRLQFGLYWVKRARMLVLVSGSTELNSAEALAMRAEKHEQDRQFVESAEQYEQAAAKADANRQAENMFLYNHHAALAWTKALEQLPQETPKIEYQKRLVAVLTKLVAQNPQHPNALQFHLSAINAQGLIVLSQPEAFDDYLALVEEHAEHWHDSPQLQHFRRLSVILLERQGRIDEVGKMLPLLDGEQLETLTPEIQRLRVRQLDADGKTQEAVDILKTLLKQKREPATVQLFAEILARQSDAASLKVALEYWTLLEQSVERNSETWWAAREGIIDVLFKQNRREDAKKSFDFLRISYPDLGGAERKIRLTKRFE